MGAGQGNAGEGKGSQDLVIPLPLLGVPQEHRANNHNIRAEDLGQTYAGTMTAASFSVSPYEPCLSGAYSSSSTSSAVGSGVGSGVSLALSPALRIPFLLLGCLAQP